MYGSLIIILGLQIWLSPSKHETLGKSVFPAHPFPPANQFWRFDGVNLCSVVNRCFGAHSSYFLPSCSSNSLSRTSSWQSSLSIRRSIYANLMTLFGKQTKLMRSGLQSKHLQGQLGTPVSDEKCLSVYHEKWSLPRSVGTAHKWRKLTSVCDEKCLSVCHKIWSLSWQVSEN